MASLLRTCALTVALVLYAVTNSISQNIKPIPIEQDGFDVSKQYINNYREFNNLKNEGIDIGNPPSFGEIEQIGGTAGNTAKSIVVDDSGNTYVLGQY